MPSRLSLHFQNMPTWNIKDWAQRALRNGGELYVKMINPPTDNPFDGLPVRVIGRVHPDDNGSAKACQRDGAIGGHRWWDFWRSFRSKRPWVYAWESWNEPQPMEDRGFIMQLVAAIMHWCNMMSQEAPTLGPNVAVGWPFLGFANEPAYRNGASDIPLLAPAFDALDFWSFHEYGWPFMQNDQGFHCLRYRESLRQLDALGIPRKPTFITECGLDGLLAGPHPAGWRTLPDTSFDDYLGQLAWYDRELAKDGVVSAFIFTAGAGSPWESYDIGQEEAWRLADYIAADPPSWEPGATSHVVNGTPGGISTTQDVITPRIVNMLGKLSVHPTVEGETRDIGAITHTVIHHSGGSQRPGDGTQRDVRRYIKGIARWHVFGETKRKKPWPWISYDYIIAADGTIYTTNQITNVTYHCGNLAWNKRSVAVCLLGDFRAGHDTPTNEQLVAAKWLVRQLGRKVVPHKRIVRTACPGDCRARWWKELKEAGK